MDDKDKWREAIGGLYDVSKYEPVAPQSAALPIDVPVNAGVESRGPGRPAYRAGVDLGPVSLEGSYQRRDPRSPPEWSAMARYRRNF